ncbi:MAG: tryptophan 2,3-dioxygenase family protein [Egibacteraceae bacterium]
MADPELNYLTYLKVPQLLSLQQLRSQPPHPEELHFIVVHQALELWFKLLLHDLERTIGALDADDWPGALVLLRRINDIMTTGLDQMRSLHDMPPLSLHEFRSYLGTASGLQSVQFRELELLSGLRDPAYLRALRSFSDGELAPELQRRMEQRSLAEAHADAGRRLGIAQRSHWADLYAGPGGCGPFYLVCEALVDYDERWIRWRNEHVTLVERTLGPDTRGTAGTVLGYLQRTTSYRYFPQLWELRGDLAVRGGGQLVDGR